MISDRPPRGPEEHKQAARELGLSRGDTLLALHRNQDPFYKGTPAHWKAARWFKEVWEQFGYTSGVHLRRIHYQLLSTGAQTATGETYENTEGCWYDLMSASRAARQLGLVDPESFDDRRNDPARLNIKPRWEQPEPAWSWAAPWERPWWTLPRLDPSMLLSTPMWSLPSLGWWVPALELPSSVDWPEVGVDGYDYHPDDQPVLLEVWIEKSTMDDVLVPLCEDLHANLVTAVGFESITNTIALLRRAERHGKPAHVLYISDFDPAGEHMPVAVARQAQFWREQLDIQAEVTIEPVALTAEQVERFKLPRVPIKKSDPRGERFEERNGNGAVELDALEALHPGALAEAVHHAAQPYIDPTLYRQLADTEQQALSDVAEALAEEAAPVDERLAAMEADVYEVTGRYEEQLQVLRAEVRDTMAPYQERLNRLYADVNAALKPHRERLRALADELADDLEPHRERLDELADEAAQVVAEFDPDLPARPEPAAPDVDRSGLLFDSTRHWREQLRVFKAWQAGETP